MDYLQFMNSKTLFKVRGARVAWVLADNVCSTLSRLLSQFQRKDPVGKNRLPVMVHINYHPDKARRPLRFSTLSADSGSARLSGSA